MLLFPNEPCINHGDFEGTNLVIQEACTMQPADAGDELYDSLYFLAPERILKLPSGDGRL